MNKTNIKYFLSGLICGEGCFSHYINKSRNFPEFRFIIDMHNRDRILLELLQKEIGIGKIKTYPSMKSHMIRFEICSHKDNVEKIIPYFDNILIGYKKIQFENWKNKLLNHYAGRKERRRKASATRSSATYYRNKKIYKLSKKKKQSKIAKDFNLSRQRINQIIKKISTDNPQ